MSVYTITDILGIDLTVKGDHFTLEGEATAMTPVLGLPFTLKARAIKSNGLNKVALFFISGDLWGVLATDGTTNAILTLVSKYHLPDIIEDFRVKPYKEFLKVAFSKSNGVLNSFKFNKTKWEPLTGAQYLNNL
jgi:hypothetical protein